MNAIFDSVRIEADVTACELCGSTSRVGRGLCLNCLLLRCLGSESENKSTLTRLLDEIEVRDADWRIGNYQILEEIGRGGMGVIYRARQRHSRRIVALKRILSFQADSQETLARFRREAEAAASLDHPNILPIYEVSEGEDGLPFFSMKFAPGGSLLDAAPALRNEPRRSVEVMAKVAHAVHYAHSHGILHRDLKPGNILLDGCGEPLVSDFGLAKWLDTTSDVTRTLTIFGTPGYIAPEQAKRSAAKLTPAADVYSLGALLFDLFTGRPPFLGEHALAVIQQASEKPAPKLRSLIPGFDRDLETICAKCLEREPNARYRSAGDLAEDLERWLEGRPIKTRRVLPSTHVWRWSRRNPSTSVLVTLLLALAVGLSLFVWNRQPAVLIPRSVAVLPFQDVKPLDYHSPDTEHAYLADGIQDEILTRLAGIADLKVISRTFTQRYYSKPRNLSQIAKQLGVANILEGSVQKTGDQIRVSVQLINTPTDSHLWADTYERKLTDIFEVESEIVKRIAESLHLKLTDHEQQALAVKPTNNPEAYEVYLRGQAIIAWHRFLDADLLVKIAGFYERAVQLDPNFALAWARLSRVHAHLYLLSGLDATSARRDAAKRALDNAQKLAPNSTETLLALGHYQYWVLHDNWAAKATFGRVTKMLPGSSEVPWAFGLVTRREGNREWIFNPANGHEYRLTTGYYWGVSDAAARSRPDWFDAEEEAVASGGHLVTINDEAENNWLVSLFVPGDPVFDAWGACLWTGLSDFGSEGSFYWISGEPATFTNWDGLQPDNAHEGGEDSVHTNHFGGLGRWNDLGAPGNSPHHLNPYHGIIERSNQPSAADASMDQTVDEGVLVALNGRDSCDAFGSILTYSWTQAAGPAVVLSDRWPSSRRVKRDQAKGVGRAGCEKCGESFGRERSL